MPFCGASKTKASTAAKPVQNTVQNVSRDLPTNGGVMNMNNQAAPAPANQAAVDAQIAQYKRESAAKHQQEVAQWEQKFNEKITEVKTKQAQKHDEEMRNIQQQHDQERSQHMSEVALLQAEIEALQRAQKEAPAPAPAPPLMIPSASTTNVLSVHESRAVTTVEKPRDLPVESYEAAPVWLPNAETTISRDVAAQEAGEVAPATHSAPMRVTHSVVDTAPVTHTTTVQRAPSTYSTTEYKTLNTYESRTLPYTHSSTKYVDETIPNGEGLPPTRVTYHVLSDSTTHTGYTSYTETAPRESARYTRGLGHEYQNTTIPTGEGLPETRVTYTVLSEGPVTHTSLPRTTAEYTSTHYTTAVEPAHREYYTTSVDDSTLTAGGQYSYDYAPTSYTSTSAPAASEYTYTTTVDEL